MGIFTNRVELFHHCLIVVAPSASEPKHPPRLSPTSNRMTDGQGSGDKRMSVGADLIAIPIVQQRPNEVHKPTITRTLSKIDEFLYREQFIVDLVSAPKLEQREHRRQERCHRHLRGRSAPPHASFTTEPQASIGIGTAQEGYKFSVGEECLRSRIPEDCDQFAQLGETVFNFVVDASQTAEVHELCKRLDTIGVLDSAIRGKSGTQPVFSFDVAIKRLATGRRIHCDSELPQWILLGLRQHRRSSEVPASEFAVSAAIGRCGAEHEVTKDIGTVDPPRSGVKRLSQQLKQRERLLPTSATVEFKNPLKKSWDQFVGRFVGKGQRQLLAHSKRVTRP